MITLRVSGKLSRQVVAVFLLSVLACARDDSPTKPPAPAGPRLFLEIAPGAAVYQQDSTHCVVAEGRSVHGQGWEVYWRVRRNVTEGEAGFRVRTQAGTASEESEFGSQDIPLGSRRAKQSSDLSSMAVR